MCDCDCAGQYTNQTASVSCLSCAAGSWSYPGQSTCTLCPLGTASAAVGASNGTCTPCAAGSYADTQGSTQCKACSAGTYAGVGASSCALCLVGTYSLAEAASCTFAYTYWSFDSSLSDLTGLYPLTAIGSSPPARTLGHCAVGSGCVHLSGDLSSYFSLPVVPFLTRTVNSSLRVPMMDWSVAAWVNVTDASALNVVLSSWLAPSPTNHLFQLSTNDNDLQFAVNACPTGGGSTCTVPLRTAGWGGLQANTWTHLALTYRAGVNSSLTMYVNGVFQDDFTNVQPLLVDATAQDWRVGQETTGIAAFQGSIDELYLVGAQLTAVQVLSLAQGGVYGSPTTARPQALFEPIGDDAVVGCSTGVVVPGCEQSFESPAQSGGGWTYSPSNTAWMWQSGGIAAVNSPWDAPSPSSPPDGSQYAYLQDQGSMSATVTQLSASSTYSVTFWVAVRAQTADPTSAYLGVTVGGVSIYSSASHVSDTNGGWTQVTTSTFSSSGDVTLRFFTAVDTGDDQAVLIDAITVIDCHSLSTVTSGCQQSFETPLQNTDGYTYTPTGTPWSWQSGGVATVGSPWDPPSPAASPDGSQYAFLQGPASMTTTVSALTVGGRYMLTFLVAVRAQTENPTDSTLLIRVDGTTVYASTGAVGDVLGGWKQVTTTSFISPQAQVTLQVSTDPSSGADQAVLIDGVTVVDCMATDAFSLGCLQSFESPPLASGGYTYFAEGSPWSWKGEGADGLGGGIAALGSPWDAPSPSSPPDGSQYAYLQDGSSMYTTVVGLSNGEQYVLSFSVGVRTQTQNPTDDTLVVSVCDQVVYRSPSNVYDSGGWQHVLTQPFTPLNDVNYMIEFTAAPMTGNDQAVLIDAVNIVAV